MIQRKQYQTLMSRIKEARKCIQVIEGPRQVWVNRRWLSKRCTRRICLGFISLRTMLRQVVTNGLASAGTPPATIWGNVPPAPLGYCRCQWYPVGDLSCLWHCRFVRLSGAAINWNWKLAENHTRQRNSWSIRGELHVPFFCGICVGIYGVLTHKMKCNFC